jgi:hypothetical protein
MSLGFGGIGLLLGVDVAAVAGPAAVLLKRP